MPSLGESGSLSSCHGYEAAADDGCLGEVETPIFPPGCDIPDYLVVRSVREGRARRAFVGVALVASVDRERRVVRLRGSVEELFALPSSLPLARRL